MTSEVITMASEARSAHAGTRDRSHIYTPADLGSEPIVYTLERRVIITGGLQGGMLVASKVRNGKFRWWW